MPRAPQQRVTVYNGPSLFAAFPAIVAEFSNPAAPTLSAERLGNYLAGAFPGALPASIGQPNRYIAFDEVVVSLTRVMQGLSIVGELPVEMQRTEAGSARIAIGFQDQRVAIEALRAALQIASMMFGTDEHGTDPRVATAIEQAARTMNSLRPDYATRTLMRAARDRHIPVYAVASGSGIWRYGQGSAGRVFSAATTTGNSLFGSSLARNKYRSNQLVMQLGLPGVEHGLANTFEGAAQIARQLGFPVVVKPIDLRKGQGVSANILDAEELRAAFAKARSVTQGPVLVERHVPGDDHRLAVFGGKLKWVSRRSPARIVGNGHSTVAELIETENGNRVSDIAAGLAKRLVVDADMQTVLAKQGLSLADRPPAGRTVALRSVANIATGGTITDCTASIHPDNRDMAEAVARGFHIEATGIDFITTDISKSWRELPCAVIEVNAAPGLSGQARADQVLAEAIPLGSDGRLPSIVLIGADQPMIERVAEAVQPFVQRVGQTNGAVTLLAGQARCKAGTPLPARVQALALDPCCDALVIGTSTRDIETHGFPLDRCDLALIAETAAVSEPIRLLIKACADQVLEGVSAQDFELRVLPTVATHVRKRVSSVGV